MKPKYTYTSENKKKGLKESINYISIANQIAKYFISYFFFPRYKIPKEIPLLFIFSIIEQNPKTFTFYILENKISIFQF